MGYRLVVGLQPFVEGWAGAIGEREKNLIAIDARVVDGNNIGMVQHCRRFGFFQESFSTLAIVDATRQWNFDGDHTLELRVIT